MTEGLSLASSFKTLVAENAMNASSSLNIGYTAISATKNVSAVTVASTGIISVTMNPNAKSVQFSLVPYDSTSTTALAVGSVPNGPVIWICQVSTTTNDRYVPTECRVLSISAVQTSGASAPFVFLAAVKPCPAIFPRLSCCILLSSFQRLKQ